MTNHSAIKRISIGLLSASIAAVGAIVCTFTTAESAQAQIRSRRDYHKNSLTAGQSLYKLGGLTSTNKCFNLVMQNDGNLVIYDNSAKSALWGSGTENQVNAYQVMFQRDGNFAISTRDGEVIWSAPGLRKGGKFIILEDNGNLAIYDNKRNSFWSSGKTVGVPRNKVCRF